MNTRFLRALSFAGAFLLAAAALPLSSLATPTDLPASAQAKGQALQDSLPLFAAGNWGEAEKALHRANTQKPGTPEWDFEAGQNLLEVLSTFHNQNNPTVALAAARLAATHFAHADSAFAAGSDATVVANERELAGVLYEEWFGDPKTAEKLYASAAALAPGQGLAAQRLERLRLREAQQAAKDNGAGQ
jgi:hypothetical protein